MKRYIILKEKEKLRGGVATTPEGKLATSQPRNLASQPRKARNRKARILEKLESSQATKYLSLRPPDRRSLLPPTLEFFY